MDGEEDANATLFLEELADALDVGGIPETPTDDPAADAADASLYAEMSTVVKAELEAAMRPEFLNRMVEIVVFSPLAGADFDSICSLMVDGVAARAQRAISLRVGNWLRAIIVGDGGASAYTFGARPMRRAVQRYLEDTVGDAIVGGFMEEGDVADVEMDAGGGDRMWIVRERDRAEMEVAVEDVDAGIGSRREAPGAVGEGALVVNGEAYVNGEVQPDAVQL